MKRSCIGWVVALFLGCSVVGIQAADEWEWAISPYAFLPSLDLDSTLAGQTVPVDLSFSDVVDTFDVFALSIRGEAWKNQWGMVGDLYWVDLEADGGPDDSLNVHIKEWYFDALAGYRWIMPTDFARAATADVTFGLRYHSLEQKLGATAAQTDAGASENWIDIMFGARYIRPFSKSWLFMLRGDIGGFDLTDGTKLNYSATGGLGWEFSRSWLLDVGYRLYGIDYDNGEKGLSNMGLDGTEHGLYLGVTYAPRDA